MSDKINVGSPSTRTAGRRASARRMRGDEGAALVEFAIIAPMLFLLVFGIIEFGWTFLQNLDVRHGAREGARLVAVNYRPNANSGAAQTTDIVNEICDRLDKQDNVTVEIDLQGTDAAIGGSARVRISKPDEQLTGFLGFALNNVTLTSTVEIRLEQAATWSNTPGGGTACP